MNSVPPSERAGRKRTDDRERTEVLLRESDAKYLAIFEGSPEGILVADQATKAFRHANPAICKMFGYTEHELLQLGASQIHPPEHVQSVLAEFEAQARREKVMARDVPCLRKDGSVFYADIRSTPLVMAGRPMLVGFFSDITDRKRAEEALRRVEEAHLNQMRRLAREAERILEAERAKVSRHLHDGVGQALTSLIMRLAWTEKRIRASDPSLGDELEQARDQVVHIIDDIRKVATSLRPVEIDHEGLITSIRSYVAEFQRLSGIKCRIVVRPQDLAVRERFATPVFRIIQEAMTNITRHARATRCEIRLNATHHRLELKIQDNGRGAKGGTLDGHQSLGILGMKERASAVGGTVRVRNGPRAGVLVTACFPLADDNPAAGS